MGNTGSGKSKKELEKIKKLIIKAHDDFVGMYAGEPSYDDIGYYIAMKYFERFGYKLFNDEVSAEDGTVIARDVKIFYDGNNFDLKMKVANPIYFILTEIELKDEKK